MRPASPASAPRLKDPADHIILPEIISKEPLGPVVRHGDNQWGDIVRWTHNVTLIAEEKGITQANVDDREGRTAPTTPTPTARSSACWASTDKMGEGLGLSNDWAYNIIKAVGNYGEIFERNVGPKTPMAVAARPQRAVDPGWSAIRAAGPLDEPYEDVNARSKAIAGRWLLFVPAP